jgi:hypothetical protein
MAPLDAWQELKYLGVIATNQLHIPKEVKSKCNSQNACYRSVQKFSTSYVLPGFKCYFLLVRNEVSHTV